MLLLFDSFIVVYNFYIILILIYCYSFLFVGINLIFTWKYVKPVM